VVHGDVVLRGGRRPGEFKSLPAIDDFEKLYSEASLPGEAGEGGGGGGT